MRGWRCGRVGRPSADYRRCQPRLAIGVANGARDPPPRYSPSSEPHKAPQRVLPRDVVPVSWQATVCVVFFSNWCVLKPSCVAGVCFVSLFSVLEIRRRVDSTFLILDGALAEQMLV